MCVFFISLPLYAQPSELFLKGQPLNIQSVVEFMVSSEWFNFWCNSPQWARASSFTRFLRSHITTHHSRYDSSGRVISSSQKALPDNTQYSKETDIHAHGRIRTHDLSKRATVDLHLRPRGHWDRHVRYYY